MNLWHSTSSMKFWNFYWFLICTTMQRKKEKRDWEHIKLKINYLLCSMAPKNEILKKEHFNLLRLTSFFLFTTMEDTFCTHNEKNQFDRMPMPPCRTFVFFLCSEINKNGFSTFRLSILNGFLLFGFLVNKCDEIKTNFTMTQIFYFFFSTNKIKFIGPFKILKGCWDCYKSKLSFSSLFPTKETTLALWCKT